MGTTLLELEIQLVELPGSTNLRVDNGQISAAGNCFAAVKVGGILVRGNAKSDPAAAVRDLFWILSASAGTGDRGADAEMGVALWIAGTSMENVTEPSSVKSLPKSTVKVVDAETTDNAD